MTHRHVAHAFVAAIALVAVSSTGVHAQDDPPRTSWGAPDLGGVWDYRTLTPVQRSEGRAEFLTDEEVAARRQREIDRNAELAERPARRTELDPTGNVDRGVDGAPGSYNSFWFDRGVDVVPTKRTSLVIDPPNGRIPPLTPEAEARRAALAERRKGVGTHEPTPGGWVEDIGANGLKARCMIGSNAGPPILPRSYNNNMQVFQTPDHIVVLNEMVHSSRVIPIDGPPPLTSGVRQWMGDSRARWDGDTLVVETANFLRETSFLEGASSAAMRITERFTRMSPELLIYTVTVDDSDTWTRPWTYELPMRSSSEQIYEFACHEGNYGLYNILAGAARTPTR